MISGLDSPKHPVSIPPQVSTYSPSFGNKFSPNFGPAAIVTLSEAAQNWLREQRQSRVP